MKHVFTFGCPRSGTTYLERLFDVGRDYEHQKIREGDWLHPCVGDTGLIMLAQLFRDDPPIFVRIVRQPVEIFRSFYGARQITDDGRAGQKIDGMYGGIAKIALNNDARIFKFIDMERANVEAQKEEARIWSWDFNLFEIEYERLDDRGYVDILLTEICTLLPYPQLIRTRLSEFHEAHWKQKPVREGRFSHDEHDVELPDDLLNQIETRYG